MPRAGSLYKPPLLRLFLFSTLPFIPGWSYPHYYSNVRGSVRGFPRASFLTLLQLLVSKPMISRGVFSEISLRAFANIHSRSVPHDGCIEPAIGRTAFSTTVTIFPNCGIISCYIEKLYCLASLRLTGC